MTPRFLGLANGRIEALSLRQVVYGGRNLHWGDQQLSSWPCSMCEVFQKTGVELLSGHLDTQVWNYGKGFQMDISTNGYGQCVDRGSFW